MRTELVTLTASVLINAGILFSVDHAAVRMDQALVAEHRKQAASHAASQAADSLSFEFVEAPPDVSHFQRPRPSRKISNQDSLNRDLTRDKSAAEGAPHLALGPTDQLMQRTGKPASSPSPESPKIAPKPAQLEPQMQEPKKAPLKSEEALKPRQEQKVEEVTLAPQQPPGPARPASAASQPRPAIQGTEGRDRITTSEISRTRSHGAQIYGVTSFEATGSGMGVYIKNMKERIWLAWFPYLMVHYPKDFKTADALVSFKIDAKGEVKIVRVLESKGSPLFSAFCMESVQRASPFGPLPQEIRDLTGKDELEIKFAFHYW